MMTAAQVQFLRDNKATEWDFITDKSSLDCTLEYLGSSLVSRTDHTYLVFCVAGLRSEAESTLIQAGYSVARKPENILLVTLPGTPVVPEPETVKEPVLKEVSVTPYYKKKGK